MPASDPPRPAPLPPDDQALAVAFAVIRQMPRRRRNEFLSLVDFLLGLTGEELALVAKAVRPYIDDEEVAALCGVGRRTLFNWKRYQAIKLRVEDYLETRRRQWYLPDDPAA